MENWFELWYCNYLIKTVSKWYADLIQYLNIIVDKGKGAPKMERKKKSIKS